jgi:hypothetical protein
MFYEFFHNGKKISKKKPIDLSSNPIIELVEYNYVLDNGMWFLALFYLTIFELITGFNFLRPEEMRQAWINSKTIQLNNPEQEKIEIFFDKEYKISQISGVGSYEILKESKEKSLKAIRRVKIWRIGFFSVAILLLLLVIWQRIRESLV